MHRRKVKLREKGAFIAGTDTGIGKTVVTRLLTDFLISRGIDTVSQKWVETGARPNPAYGKYSAQRPYVFKFASSPHLASRLEKITISASKIKRAFKALSEMRDFVVVEGTGGVLVPIHGKAFLLDAAKELRLPVMLICGNKLGAINHALLSIEALRKRKITVTGLIFNDMPRQNYLILRDNVKIIRKFSRVPVLGRLPRSRSISFLRKRFEPIGGKILNKI